MRALIKAKPFLIKIGVALLWALNSVTATAQCAMCKASAKGASADSAAFSETLNLAILVLLIPPVLIFCAIFFVAFRYRKALDDSPAEAFKRARIFD